MKTLIRSIGIILGLTQLNSQTTSKVYHHVHPTTYHLNGRSYENTKKRYSISSLSKAEFIEYYRKSKNIICL